MLTQSLIDRNMLLHIFVQPIEICFYIVQWIEICFGINWWTENYYFSLKDPLSAVLVVQLLIFSLAAIFVVQNTILESDGFFCVTQEHGIFLDMCVVCDICIPVCTSFKKRILSDTNSLLGLLCNMELISYYFMRCIEKI